LGESKSDVTDLNGSSSRVFHLIKSLKGYAGGSDKKQRFSVNNGIQNTLAMFQHILKTDIELDIALDSRLLVNGNEQSLNQIWTNLINNAIEAIEGKGRLSIISKDVDNQVLIEFCDNGIGIHKDHQSKIFTLNHSTKKQKSGIGIGLYTCREIANAHNGDISFNSDKNGTCFRLLLPIAEEQSL
jgi:signal transduction histidine kinase